MFPTKFQFICPNGFRGEDLNVKSLQTTDAFRLGEPIISPMFYEICEYMYQFCLISISIYNLTINIHIFPNTYCSIPLSWSACLLGEQDQFRLVFLQSLSVLLERLNTLVLSTIIYSNTNGQSLLFVDTSCL
jgi:hypothetical protein